MTLNLAEWIKSGELVPRSAHPESDTGWLIPAHQHEATAALRRAELLEELAVLAGRGCVGDVGGWHIWHNALRVLEILVALAEGDA